MEHLPVTVIESNIAPPSRRKWLVYGVVSLLLSCLTWVQPAQADWTDDQVSIAEQASQGNFLVAEELASQSLQNGPGTFLFAETGTLVIKMWRARLRLLNGDTQGATADANDIIQANSSFFPQDAGYGLRAMANAVEGNSSASESDFATAIKLSESGSMSAIRIYGGKGE